MAKKKTPIIQVEAPAPEELGPAMLALTETQRKWVVAYVSGCDATTAARLAGYSDVADAAQVRGCELLQKPTVVGAIKEWTTGALEGRGAFVAIQALIEIAADPEHKKRFEAADSLADRVGFARVTQHQVSVEHRDERTTAQLLDAIEAFAAKKRPVVIENKPVAEIEHAENSAT